MTDPAALSDTDLTAAYLRAVGSPEAAALLAEIERRGLDTPTDLNPGGSLTADDLGNFA